MKRMIVDKDKDPGINSMKEQDQQDQNLKLMIKDKQEDEKSSDIESSSLIDQKQKRKRNEEEEEKNNKDKSNKLTDNKEEEIGKGNKRRRVDEEDQNSYNLNLYQLPPLPLFETPENPLITFTLQKDNRELSLPPFQTITLTTPSLFIVEQLTPLIKTQFIKPKPNELNKLPKAYPKRKRSISEKRMSVEESNFSTLTPQRLLDSSISQRSIQSSQSSFQTLNENHQMSLTFCVVSAGIQPEVIPSQMCIGVVYAMYTPKRQNKLLGLSFRRLRNK
ncbi:MAG: hypothetical protein EZS28_013771 [Streblomastix strix]|uniref:Uncharacterized protein n=1 Tax=Streblomastix strix TaxID=222440 RepID=A0A5J4W6Z2_9EUKA|nr:MAG: hypothetical protein EZS28_013771 [Streblomastix strix]